MARLEYIRYVPHRSVLVDGCIEWIPVRNGNVIDGLPQIIWSNSTPWREANLWACERAASKDVNLKTVESNARALHALANWLEETGTDWWDFPPRKADRCLVRYRGALIKARDEGDIAPSTATERMASVVRFYRWIHVMQLLSPTWPMWKKRIIGIRLTDAVGFERTMQVNSTDLAIPNRRAPGERLENGLLPVSAHDRDDILAFAKERASEEFFLMLTSGFFSGMRLGTITDLKIQTLERAVQDPATPELFRLAVGPGADPPVHTKFGVTGHVWITRVHLDELRNYAYSVRRLKRQGKAAPENKDIVFLTRFGNTYAMRSSDKSPALNVEMHTFRKRGLASGLPVLRHFHFHQSRCTFATELARLAIRVGGAINAIAIVMEAMLHRDEATAFRYIKFVEKTPAKVEAANAFTRDFLGLLKGREEGATDA